MALEICQNCGDKIVDKDQKFCANCGYNLTNIQGKQKKLIIIALEFCPNCGDKIVDKDQKFCANCGYNLTNIQGKQKDETLSAKQSQPKPQETKINVHVPAPSHIDGSGRMGNDYKEDRIKQYKNLMGMNTGVNNTVLSEVSNGPILGPTSAIIENLIANWFILSFEDEGLVLIGVDKRDHFNEKNFLLPNDIIKTVKVHKGLGRKKLIFTPFSGKSIKFYINFALIGCPYQHQNYKNLENLVSKYNK